MSGGTLYTGDGQHSDSGIQGLSAAGWTALRIGCSLLEIVLQSLRLASGSCSCGIHAGLRSAVRAAVQHLPRSNYKRHL